MLFSDDFLDADISYGGGGDADWKQCGKFDADI